MAEVKLMMTWDILPGKEEDYFEFHIREFIPALENLGISLSEAWLTVYGSGPRLMAEAIIPNKTKARDMIRSNEWEELGIQLTDFVENFNFKIIPALTRWQM